MKSLTCSMWQRTNLKRVTIGAVVIAIAGAVLFLFLASLGDSDLAPYSPPFPGECAAWVLCGVTLWPLVLTALVMGQDPPLIASLPLLFLSGLFWAMLVEVAITWKRRGGIEGAG